MTVAASTEYPRRGRGAAATRPLGISASHPAAPLRPVRRGRLTRRPRRYELMGTNEYFGNWSVTKKIGTPWASRSAEATGDETYYSTFDFVQSARRLNRVAATPRRRRGWFVY